VFYIDNMNIKQAKCLEQNLQADIKSAGDKFFDKIFESIKANYINLGLSGYEEYLALQILAKEKNGQM